MKRRVDVNQHEQSDKILENLSQITALNEAFFEDKTNDKGVVTKITNTYYGLNPLPIIDALNYKGPTEILAETCFGEYISALNAFVDFSQNADETSLDWLLASLYRPICKIKVAENIEDTREDFNEKKIAHYASKTKALPYEFKYGVFLWFASCQKYIVTCDDLELSGGGTVDLSILFKGSKSNEKSIGMAGLVFDLAESSVFGSSEKVKEKNTLEILTRMVQVKQQAEKLKRNANN